MLRPLILIAALAAATTVWSQSQPRAGDSKRGQALYQSTGCYACHGTTGAGAGRFGPKLAPGPIPFAAFEYQLRTPRERMPAYSTKVFSDAAAADVYAYLLSIPPGPSASDIPLLKPND
jgi:mono/diheme cytochrome c family protein